MDVDVVMRRADMRFEQRLVGLRHHGLQRECMNWQLDTGHIPHNRTGTGDCLYDFSAANVTSRSSNAGNLAMINVYPCRFSQLRLINTWVFAPS